MLLNLCLGGASCPYACRMMNEGGSVCLCVGARRVLVLINMFCVACERLFWLAALLVQRHCLRLTRKNDLRSP